MSTIDRRTMLAGSAGALAIAATAKAHDHADVPDDVDLAGKSVLITGCSSGFGRLSAEYLAKRGAKVFATMRNIPRPEADELRSFAEEHSVDLTVIEIDVLDDEQVSAGVAMAEDMAGGALDVLVNNAGIAFSGPVEVQDVEATQLIFETNVYGPHRMARAALPAMRAAKSGLVINVTSQLGRVILPSLGQYSPSKFALEAMSEQMAYELVPHGVDVSIIQPGGYPTAIWKNGNRLSGELKDRTSEERLAAYPELTAQMGDGLSGGGTTDPMDIPRAMGKLMATPAGQRPLRVPVHPGDKPQVAINEVSAKTQVAMLGESPYGPWVKAAHNVD